MLGVTVGVAALVGEGVVVRVAVGVCEAVGDADGVTLGVDSGICDAVGDAVKVGVTLSVDVGVAV